MHAQFGCRVVCVGICEHQTRVCVCVCVCVTWEFGKPNKSRCSPTVIRACEIVPLKMLWSECVCVCVCVCVCGLCGPSLLSLFRILGNEKAASWFPGACSLRPPFRCFFFLPPLPACVFFWSHTTVFLPALRCCEVRSNIFIKSRSSFFYRAAEVVQNAFITTSIRIFIPMLRFSIF